MAFSSFSADEIRRQFPILEQTINGFPLIYLDNAATTQKPNSVVDAVCHYYQKNNANVHRASHYLSNQATTDFENSREKVRAFINAKSTKEIIWTKGTTEGFNLLAHVFGTQLQAGDEVIISALEHHANIVPWQMLVESVGIKLNIIPLNEDCSLDLDAYKALLNSHTKLVSIAHISNALGVINPIKKVIKLAHEVEALVIIDGAQAIAHCDIDVIDLDCDFYLFSGHKLFAPTGVGVLYGKQHLLEQLPPWQGGGEMIKRVSFAETTYNELPFKFEAGTPNISAVIGLGAAIDFISLYDPQLLMEHEIQLLKHLENELLSIPQVTIFAKGVEKLGALSFTVKEEHHSDISMLLDAQGIAVRSGTHCAMPLMQLLNCTGTVRVSISIYNTRNEIDIFIKALKTLLLMLAE